MESLLWVNLLSRDINRGALQEAYGRGRWMKLLNFSGPLRDCWLSYIGEGREWERQKLFWGSGRKASNAVSDLRGRRRYGYAVDGRNTDAVGSFYTNGESIA
jgi:hypothetical protein